MIVIASILLNHLNGSPLAGVPSKSYSTHRNGLQIWAGQAEAQALAAAFFSTLLLIAKINLQFYLAWLYCR